MRVVNTSERTKLPHKRNGYVQKCNIGGHKFYMHTGEYNDGSLGEIFLTLHKDGTITQGLMNAFSMAVSLGLQYGVPLQEYIDAFTSTRFEPNGIVTGHDSIKTCTSILDAIFRDLGINYGGQKELGNIVDTSDELDVFAELDEVTDVATNQIPCNDCGSLNLIKSGTCYVCGDCGTSQGCS